MEGLLNLIRICICFGYIDLDYDIFSLPEGACRCYRRLYLSDLGTEYCNEPKQIELPDPLCTEVSKLTKSGGKQKRRSLSQAGVPNVKKLLKDSSAWLILTDEKQYRALGFGLEEFPFLYYVKNWKEVKGASTREFIRNDLQMTKGAGQSIKRSIHETEVDGEKLKVQIRINKCMGCKKCPVESCQVGFSNYAKFNDCVEHKREQKSVVTCGENCPVSFVYVTPQDPDDTRQWFRCVSRKSAGHDHPSPVDWKLKSQTKKDLKAAQISNPYGKPKDFQKGLGLE